MKCDFCKRVLGKVVPFSNYVRILYFDLVRLDPYQLVNVCENVFYEDGSHDHTNLLLIKENDIDSPAPGIGHLRIRRYGLDDKLCVLSPSFDLSRVLVYASAVAESANDNNVLPPSDNGGVVSRSNDDFENFRAIYNRLLDNEPSSSTGHSTETLNRVMKMAYAEYCSNLNVQHETQVYCFLCRLEIDSILTQYS